jgi:GAF domain-containing protein
MGPARARRPARARSDTRLQRLIAVSARLHSSRSTKDAHAQLVHGAIELSRAQRALLVRQTPNGRDISALHLPAGEDGPALLSAIGTWLDDAQRSRAARLRHGPAAAPASDQRSCVVAPLLVNGEVVAYLYADVDGSAGRFNDVDRDLLAALAVQGAHALTHQSAIDRLATENVQRDAELTVINSIQQGISRAFDFQATVDLVGDKLRGVFASDDLMIAWHDAQADVARLLYVVQHGQRLSLPPVKAAPEGRFFQALLANQPVLANSRDEMDAWGLRTPPGLEPSTATLTVPVFVGDQLTGGITLCSAPNRP